MSRTGRIIGLATELGVTMGASAAAPILVGIWLGRRIDTTFDTFPIATMALLIAGAVTGQVSIYRLATRASGHFPEPPKHVVSWREIFEILKSSAKALALTALPSLMGFFLGYWLDHQLNSRILFTLLLVLAGLVIGIAGLLRVVKAQRKTDQG